MNGLSSHIQPIQHQLQATAARHQVISHNIANVNTPGFKAKQLDSDFDDELAVQNQITEREDAQSHRLDGNTVDIHSELGQLKRNSLLHKVYTQLLHTKLNQLKRAMDD